MGNASNGKRLVTNHTISQYAAGGIALIRARFQTSVERHVYNSDVFGYKDENMTIINMPGTEPDFDTVFSHIWRVFFTPSPPVASKIQSKLDELGLKPNHYVASHLRALYGVENRAKQLIKKFTENALACATQIRPDVPIFFASDSSIATEYALQFNGKKMTSSNGLRVVTSVPDPNPPWHLDSFLGPTASFHDTFVDLYLLAMAGCVTYNKGGYGQWSLLIGGNIQCSMAQFIIGRKSNNPKEDFCQWSSSLNSTANNKGTPMICGNDDGPLFIPPMK